jgi:hypothetical protein
LCSLQTAELSDDELDVLAYKLDIDPDAGKTDNKDTLPTVALLKMVSLLKLLLMQLLDFYKHNYTSWKVLKPHLSVVF